MRRPPADGPRVSAADLAAQLAVACPRHGIDLAGAVPLDGPAPHAAAWRDWLDRGRHGGLAYLSRTRDDRADPRRRRPWAQTMFAFAQRYTDGWPPSDAAPEPVPPSGEAAAAGPPGAWLAHVARYARGEDYHAVLLRAVEGVLRDLQAVWPELAAYPAVDTGPYLERDWAAAAGLGFVGKNTCLIHERLGSGLLLAVAPANLHLADLAGAPRPLYAVAPRGVPPRQETSRCGHCTRCLDACPTQAFTAPFVLDAGRCLSTWTIEWQGRAPADERALQGARLFGCDVCQQVCPWNGKAVRQAARAELPPPPPAYAPSPPHADLELADLIAMSSEEFRARLRRTPLWRAHPEGLRRNALVVAANTGRIDLLEVVRRVASADRDPEVRAVAAWAAARLEERS